MLAMATGKYTILRGEDDPNAYNMEETDDDVIVQHLSGSIIERTRTAYNASDGRVSTYRVLVGRFPKNADIQDDDRIQDEKTGTTYIVDAVRHPVSLVGATEIVLDLSFA